MRLGAVKQCVVALLTLSTFILHKQNEGSNVSPPSMNSIANLHSWNLVEDQIVLIQICGYASRGVSLVILEYVHVQSFTWSM